MIYRYSLQPLPEIVLLGHSICQKGWKLPFRAVHEFELIFPYQGEFIYNLNGVEHKISTGDCLLIPPDTFHQVYTERQSQCRFFYVHFLPLSEIEMLQEEGIQYRIGKSPQNDVGKNHKHFFLLSQPAFYTVYIPEYIHLKDQHRDEIFSLFDKALIQRNVRSLYSKTEISLYMSKVMVDISISLIESLDLSSIEDTKGSIPRLLQEALYYIQENYMLSISVESISDHLEVSQQYLIRVFNQYIGISPRKYINEFRITKAKGLMRYSNMSLKEICFAIGMENPHYFSRLFKKIEGLSPSEYQSGFNSKSNE